MEPQSKGCILFDWGDTLMRDIKEYHGPMKDWPVVEAIPGAAETLAVLHNEWILAIATSADESSEADIHAALKRVYLDQWIDEVYCFKKTGYHKPTREFYQYILNDLKITPTSIFMVGDNYEADVLGANRCGIRAIWFNPRGLEDRKAGMVQTVHKLSDLPSVITNWY